MFLLRELILKYKYVRFVFLIKVIVVLILMNVSAILKGTDCLIE